ncbi:DUF1822 family protein [Planktothricoides raciborskii]|uniref:DUF1822 family protein n=1 Tax=Planktothricoides raciborskii GIHE-MW2 TaxID=2792601 RepID=A0AAU8JNG0_9CYAN
MELEEAIAFTDDLLVAKTNQGLSNVEQLIFKGSWKEKTYDEIAVDSQYRYTFSYLKQDAGPKLWSRLAEVLGEKIGKKNFKAAIERRSRSPEQTNQGQIELVWSATIEEAQISQIEAFLILLREQVKHSHLTTRKVKQGRASVVLESYLEGFHRLSELFKTGQLSEILGIPVEDVRLQSATASMLINLQQWLKNSQDELFEPDWQPPEVIASKSSRSKSAMSPYEIEAIAPLIQRLQTTNDEITRRQIATELGDIGVNFPEAIAALSDLLATSEDSETLWQAALSLGKINPSHPQAGIEMAKAIDLVSETQSVTVALLIAFRPKNEQKVSIRIRIEAIDEENDLPQNLQVTVFDQSGNTFRQAQPTNPTFLELQGFSGLIGEQFSIRLSLEEASITENFVI